MNKKVKRKKSIRTMMLWPILSVNILVVSIFVITLAASGMLFKMKESQTSSLSRTVSYRTSHLQMSMDNSTSITGKLAMDIYDIVSEAYPNEENIFDMMKDSPEKTMELLELCVNPVVETLNMRYSTGAFVMLNASSAEGNDYKNGWSENMSSFYIYNPDLLDYYSDGSEASIYLCPEALMKKLNMKTSRYRADEYRFTYNNKSGALNSTLFYTKPYENSGKVNEQGKQYGYWSKPFMVNGSKRVVTYSYPLVDKNGNVYGVAGVELSENYIKNILNANELNGVSSSGYAVIDISEGPLSRDWFFTTGTFSANILYGYSDEKSLAYKELSQFGDNIYELYNNSNQENIAVGIGYPLELYAPASPFYGENWMIMGMVKENVLFSSANDTVNYLISVFITTVVLGLISSLWLSNFFARPLTKLSKSLRGADNNDSNIAEMLEETGVKEIDSLIAAIGYLSEDLLEAGKRMTETIDMTEIPIAFFEIDNERERVFVSELIFNFFSVDQHDNDEYISVESWNELYARLSPCDDYKDENVFLLNYAVPPKWFRLKTALRNKKKFGIMMDITPDIMKRKKLEHERDIDPLTGLLNRKGFMAHSMELIANDPDRLGIMLFADLDNLKHVNDSYGHDIGDRYIRGAAEIFGQLSEHGAVASRIAGDEFAIFLYGFDDKRVLNEIVAENYRKLAVTSVEMPDGTPQKLRCSIGFSWYPDDSRNCEQLLKYADFAMYEIKHSLKGTIKEFDMDTYIKNSYLIEKNETLNQLIEQNLVKYAFQPIVDVFSGEVFAYEMLMRPQIEELASPEKVIQLAKSQSKLYQIERMTYFNVFGFIKDNIGLIGNRKIFFNSIPNQALSESDSLDLEKNYVQYYKNTVTEITENEESDYKFLSAKINSIKSMGGSIAIDDFGSGYANEAIILNANPDFIKIDMALIRDINKDEKKQSLVQNIINYAGKLDTKIIAEGVETEAEMDCVVKMGARYIQGYFFARPSFDLTDIAPENKELVRLTAMKYHDRRKR